MWQPLRLSLRSLRREPGVTIACLLTLSLGIGASTSIFEVLHAVVLRPLAFQEPDRLVQLWQVNEDGGHARFSEPNFEDLRARARSFSRMARYASTTVSVTGTESPLRVRAAAVSKDFFPLLGARVERGRFFSDDERVPEGPARVLVSHSFWELSLGAPVELAGETLGFEGEVHDVVGVLEPGFDFPGVDLWVASERLPPLPSRTAHNWWAVARLAPEVSLEAARGELSALASELRERYGGDTWMVDAAVVPLQEQEVGAVRPALLVLAVAVAFLLLVACANVVHLQLARAASRRRDIALCAALGGRTWHLTRPFVVDSVVLALLGGGLGILLSAWGTRSLLLFEPGVLPRREEIGMGPVPAAWALSVALAAGVIIGLLAAWRARSSLQATLRDSGWTLSTGGASARMRGALVGAQIALTFVLVVGAGLLASSLARLVAVDPGFDTGEGVVVDLVHPSVEGDEAKARLASAQQELLRRLREVPGVTVVGGTDLLPLASPGRNGMFLELLAPDEMTRVEDLARLARDPTRTGFAEYRTASLGYFAAAGIPLLQGRLFEASDAGGEPHVAVVSQSLARERWGDEDPLGRWIEFGNMDGDLRPFRIVGVVGDVHHESLAVAPRPTLYSLSAQRPPVGWSILVRHRGDPAALVAALRPRIREIFPDVPPRFRTLAEVLRTSLAERRFTLLLLGAFAVAALTLALIGIYGVTAWAVAQRRREVGVRVAMGAVPAAIVHLVLRDGFRWVLFGLAGGLLGSLALNRFLARLLFQVGAYDPVVLSVLALLLAGAALVAAYLPARRVARSSPALALRES